MSRRCSICGKKAIVAVVRKKLRGKYNPTTKKKKYPNLQWVFLPNGKRVKACTKCIRTMGKTRTPKEKTEKPTVEKKPKEKESSLKTKTAKKAIKKKEAKK